MAAKTTRRTAGGVVYELVRGKVKNFNLRVRPDGTVRVSAPGRAALWEVDAFVVRHKEWIAQQQREQQDRRRLADAMPEPDAQQALEHFTRLSERVYPAFAHVLGGQRPQIQVSRMRSRWGVCYPKRRQITFALQLYNQPPKAQIYVVVHEYCHFLAHGHGPEFWAQVEKLLPDWKERRKLLQMPAAAAGEETAKNAKNR